jgi:hypothetical protein
VATAEEYEEASKKNTTGELGGLMGLGRDAAQEERRFWLRLQQFSGLSQEVLGQFVSIHDAALREGIIHNDKDSAKLCIICAYREPPGWQE